MWERVSGFGFRFVVIYLVDLGFAQQLCVFFGVGCGGWGVGSRGGFEAWWLWVCGGWGVVRRGGAW